MPCSTPILIDNPNVYRVGESFYVDKIDHLTGERFKVRKVKSKTVVGSRFKSPLHKIPVPCGWCPDCVKKKQIYLIQRTQAETIAGNDLFFFTLTYQNKALPRLDVGDKRFYYVDPRDFRNMFNRIRVNKLLPFDFKYMICSEYGGKRHRPHLHGILSVMPLHQRESRAEKIARGMLIHDVILKEWRRNVAYTYTKKTKKRPIPKLIPNSRNPVWLPLCRYIVSPDGHRTFDCHYVDPRGSKNGEMDVAFYVTKYCLKPDPKMRKLQSWLKLNLSYDEYRYYWRLFSTHVWFSKEYGSPYHPKVVDHLRKGVEYAIQDMSIYPYWLSTDGRTFPLATYFQDRFFNRAGSLYVKWFDRRADWKIPDYYDERSREEIWRSDTAHYKRMDKLLERDMIDFFPD